MQLLTCQDPSTAASALWEMATDTIRPQKRLSQFSPTSLANGARSSREGESISEVLMKFEVATEFHAIKQPPVCSDIAVCLLTVHRYCKS